MHKQPTKESMLLHDQLKRYDIESELEYWDGHKHVDLYVPAANVFIEVDGPRHYTDARQMLADILRDHYSDLDGIPTIRIPNNMIESHAQEVAQAIARVAETQE